MSARSIAKPGSSLRLPIPAPPNRQIRILVILSEVSRRLFFAFALRERVGSRSEGSQRIEPPQTSTRSHRPFFRPALTTDPSTAKLKYVVIPIEASPRFFFRARFLRARGLAQWRDRGLIATKHNSMRQQQPLGYRL
jgi:hypothetical protein